MNKVFVWYYKDISSRNQSTLLQCTVLISKTPTGETGFDQIVMWFVMWSTDKKILII